MKAQHNARDGTPPAESTPPAAGGDAAPASDRARAPRDVEKALAGLEALNRELEQRAEERARALMAMHEQRVGDLRALVEAGIAITSELSLDKVLQQIVDLARGIVHARYAALGVVSPEGGALERFVTSGMDADTEARIGSLPVGRGVLRILLHEGKPLRLPDLTCDPRSEGFPPGHPPMHSFLGVPIMARGRVFGRLYLTEKQGAPEFSDEDESLALSLAAQAAVAIENARLFAEVKEQQERLVRAERLFAVGQLASTIGHELRNPLSVINNAVYFLNRKVSREDPRVARNLDIIRAEVQAATHILQELLDFSRVRALQRTPVQVAVLFAETLEHQEVPEGVRVEVRVPEGLPRLPVDAMQMHQALRNLVENALQAMPAGGVLRLEASADAGRVVLRVSDTGVGIPPENLPRIYEPLFTTKERGVGLGLALVRRVVEAHGGRVTVESAVGKGTAFTLSLPLAAH